MTIHDKDKIIAAVKEALTEVGAYPTFGEPPHWIIRFYDIAFAAGAASRDAEIAELVALLEEAVAYTDSQAWSPSLTFEINASLAKERKP